MRQLSKQSEDDVDFLKQCRNTAVDPLVKTLQSNDPETVIAAAYTLYRLGSIAEDAVEPLSELLADEQKPLNARVFSANAIERIKARNSTVNETLMEVSASSTTADIKAAAITALGTNSNGEIEVARFLVSTISGNDINQIRVAAAYALGSIAVRYPQIIRPLADKELISVLENSNISDSLMAAYIYALDSIDTSDETTIEVFIDLLPDENELIQSAVAIALADISNLLYDQSKTLKDVNENLSKVEEIRLALEAFSDTDNSDVRESISTVNSRLLSLREKRQILYLALTQRWLVGNRAIWVFHPLIWIALILAYPSSRRIQAFFFWNKHVRAVLGCWYVGPLISAVAPFRQRLFAPFKDSLLADAKLNFFESQAYFAHSQVQLKGGKTIQPLADVLPAIKGQVILEGESGLGKTMLLRHLVSQTNRVTVFLPAHKCENGVIEAIQAKLHGQAQDADFLRHLIYSGALDICIDGLNEVRAEVRANITAFVESYFKGNIVMTTQPLLWEPPATAKTYLLQPLQKQQIQQFLMVSQGRQPDDHSPEAKDYAKNCTTFLEQALDKNQPPEELAAARRILSNPMDLSVVAQLISNGLVPDLFQLQKQQYTLMTQEYEQSWNQQFPLKQFSESVYQMRLNDTYGMTGETFYQALSIMEKEQHRMVLSRQWQDANGEPQKEWSFRHDKIMEFFLVQPFVGTSQEAQEKRHQHLGDPRFRGIYLLLARLLPPEEALALREDLIHYAADTKDHTVSDDYVQILRSRTTKFSPPDLD